MYKMTPTDVYSHTPTNFPFLEYIARTYDTGNLQSPV